MDLYSSELGWVNISHVDSHFLWSELQRGSLRLRLTKRHTSVKISARVIPRKPFRTFSVILNQLWATFFAFGSNFGSGLYSAFKNPSPSLSRLPLRSSKHNLQHLPGKVANQGCHYNSDARLCQHAVVRTKNTQLPRFLYSTSYTLNPKNENESIIKQKQNN